MSEMDVQTAGGEPDDGKFLSEDYGVGGPPAGTKVRPLAVIEAELDMLKQDTQQKELSLLSNYIEIGRRLEEAKAQLPHGKWGDWLKKKEYSQSTANNFMRLFREYGAEQQSLFGAQAKSQTFEKLSYSKAMALLALPTEEEREQFMSEHDVEHMSVRELNEALKARDAALEEAAAAKKDVKDVQRENNRLQEQMADQTRVYEAKLTSAGVEADKARAAAKAAQEALDRQRDKAQRLQVALSEANASAQTADEEHTRLLRELEELRNRPAEADTEAVEAARKAAIDEMTEKVNKAKDSLAAAQKELAELKAKEPEVRELTPEEKDALTAEAVNRAKAEGAEQIRSLEKKLAAADPDVAEFKVRWNAWREEHQKMMEVLGRIAQANEEQAAKLRQAVKAALEQMA